MVDSVVEDYSKGRVEKEIPLHLSKKKVCFGNYQKYFGIGDAISNLLVEHLPLLKRQFFSIGQIFWYWERDEYNNLLEMLLMLDYALTLLLWLSRDSGMID